MKKTLRFLENKLIHFLNKYRLHTKLVFLFVICVILPIAIIDSAVLGLIIKEEQNSTLHEMEIVANAIAIDLEDKFSQAEMIANRFYISSYMNDLLEKDYADASEYYDAYYDAHQNILKMVNANDFYFTFYTDNPTIVGGGCFFNINSVKGHEVYKQFLNENKEGLLTFYREEDKNFVQSPRRMISYIRRMSYFPNSKYIKLVKGDIEYNSIVRNFVDKNYPYDIYVCEGDRILFSNVGHSTISDEFDFLTGEEKFDYRYDYMCKGVNLSVLVSNPEGSSFSFSKALTPTIALLLIFSILLPLSLMYLYNKSINQRIYTLSRHFSNSDVNNMETIQSIDGNDEIAMLMNNYNRMVDRSNELIQTVYKGRIEQQETDIAKQRAELLALQSQINPHFLFNLLESIRMHSVIKGEGETADVLAKLSLLVRKNVDWTHDYSSIKDEMSFIDDYLALQKYRFGDRLQYSLEIEEGCENYYLPRLSLATFVENSCVHGMERKSGVCNVDIHVYEKNGFLNLEIEDTGRGMDDETVAELNEKMNNVSIDLIKNSSHVGMLNACLRLKMISKDEVSFSLESEQGMGTYILAKIPIDKIKVIKETI